MLLRLMVCLTISLFSKALVAQFVLPYGELTPSQQLMENQAKSTTQSNEEMPYEQLKIYAHEDLKYYFKSHEWIRISFGYYGYFGKETEHDYSYNFPKDKINKYAEVVLNSLPVDSFLNPRIFETVPAMGLSITKEALETINSNDNITNISINRRGKQ